MKFITSLTKIFINLFATVINKNKSALKYLFTVSLKEEVRSFYENEYLTNYEHIFKSINLAKNITKNDFSIIDVGGADGVTPQIYSKSFPSHKIWIFEPIKENYKKIEKLKDKFPDFVLIPKAAGNNVGKSIINIAERITSSSIYDLNQGTDSKIFSNALKMNGTEEIEITTLDVIIPVNENIGILKIDVQGFELEVLKGAENTLLRTSLIVLEMNNHNGYKGSPKYYELDEFLRNHKFTLYDIFPSTKDEGRLKEWDSIYLNNMYI